MTTKIEYSEMGRRSFITGLAAVISGFIIGCPKENATRTTPGATTPQTPASTTPQNPAPSTLETIPEYLAESKVFFARYDNNQNANICRINLNGADFKEIYRGAQKAWMTAMSPDRKHITFKSRTGSHLITNLEGVIEDEFNDPMGAGLERVSYAPDGNLLLNGGGIYGGIYKYDINAKTLTNIIKTLNFNNEEDFNPASSPDLSRMAYMHRRFTSEYGEAVSNNELRIANADGTNPIAVATGRGGIYTDFKIDWVNDNALVFMIDSTHAIRYLNLNTQRTQEVSPNCSFDSFILSPDKSTLALAGYEDVGLIKTNEFESSPVEPVNLYDVQTGGFSSKPNLIWHPNSNFFITREDYNYGRSCPLRIFEKTGIKEYSPRLNISDATHDATWNENFSDIVGWAPAD